MLSEKLSADGAAVLARGMVRKRFPKGQTIIEKGQAVSGAYLVLDGRLRVFTLTPAGKEATLYSIAPGETCVLAINSLFNNLLYPAWVETEDDTMVGLVPGATWRALFQRETAVQDLTVRALSTAVFRLMAELEEVHSCRLDQRLASFLLNHADGGGMLRMTQQAVAGHIGTTREVVARLVGDLVAAGTIASGRGQLRILRPEGLRALVGRG